MVTAGEPEQLAAIPAEHRETIARWILERADGIGPSFLCTPATADMCRAVLVGVAVDLADPGAEDSTIELAEAVTRRLRGRPS